MPTLDSENGNTGKENAKEKIEVIIQVVSFVILPKQINYGGFAKMRGTVKFFNRSKGWGFIKANCGQEIFVHHSNIQMDGFRTLNEGDVVQFEVSKDSTGKEQAVNVIPVITLLMVLHELSKEELHLMRIGDDKGVHGWYVVDKSDEPVVDKEMSLIDLAAYVGFDVEGLE